MRQKHMSNLNYFVADYYNSFWKIDFRNMKFSLAILAFAQAKTYEERIVDNLNDCGFFEDE